MHCLITAGPTYEPLDNVRRLTNFSTGKLGTELAGHLTGTGHEVTLLIGEQATYPGPRQARHIEVFSTTHDLLAKLKAASQGTTVHAVFHAAAVNDFEFGQVWQRAKDGTLCPVQGGKISSRLEGLMAELVPAPKLIAGLRNLFPHALLVGWKYEVDGGRGAALERAERQNAECRLNATVANGPAYGTGFGLVRPGIPCLHIDDAAQLFAVLNKLLGESRSSESKS